MRVLIFTDSDAFAGTERHMFDLALGLRAEGAQVRVACPVPSPLADRAAGAQIDTVAIPKGGLIDRYAVRTLRRMLQDGNIDVIHAHNGRTALSAALATHLAGRGACVATQHFLEPDRVGRRGPKALLSRLAHRWVSRHTHRFIAVSEAARGAMLARGDAPAERIDVVLNGLSVPELEALPAPERVRLDLGIERGDPLVVTVARLEREKDIPTLIRAMETVGERVPCAISVVAGEGTLRAELEAMALSHGRRVRLLGFRSDALALIAASDLFVLPSLAEPFGLVLLEAMALGKPVVATRAGGPCEIVVDGETGLLVPSADPEALAEAITSLLTDRVRSLSIGECGSERYQKLYTAGRMARETLAVYQAARSRNA